MIPFLCAYCGGIVRQDRCGACGAPSRTLPGIRFSNEDFEAMSDRCPVKAVFEPGLPYTEDRDHFPVARPTSLLTEGGLAYLNRKAWSRYRRSGRGREDQMKSLPLMLVISSDTLDGLRRQMQEHELRALGEGLIEGHQVMICDRMRRNDFINGSWEHRPAANLDDAMYENAGFEDSLILSPDCKTPLIAMRHSRMVIFDLIYCTSS